MKQGNFNVAQMEALLVSCHFSRKYCLKSNAPSQEVLAENGF